MHKSISRETPYMLVQGENCGLSLCNCSMSLTHECEAVCHWHKRAVHAVCSRWSSLLSYTFIGSQHIWLVAQLYMGQFFIALGVLSIAPYE